jgi:hypothetical protein
MKKIIIGILMSALIMPGCATKKIATISLEVRDDAFQEIAHKESVPAGYAELTVVSTLKTRKPGDCLWTKTSHGTPEYILLLNIDGQTARLKGDMAEDKTTSGGPWDPEAGDGIGYFFKIKLRLKPGLHRVFAALPEDGISFDREMTLMEGSNNVLILTPVYGKKRAGRLPGINEVRSFYEGIRGFNGYLNGEEI